MIGLLGNHYIAGGWCVALCGSFLWWLCVIGGASGV